MGGPHRPNARSAVPNSPAVNAEGKFVKDTERAHPELALTPFNPAKAERGEEAAEDQFEAGPGGSGRGRKEAVSGNVRGEAAHAGREAVASYPERAEISGKVATRNTDFQCRQNSLLPHRMPCGLSSLERSQCLASEPQRTG